MAVTSDIQESILSIYRIAQHDTDEIFDEKKARNPKEIQCREGCSSCCKPDLTIGVVEAASIRAHLKQNPEKFSELEKLAFENPHEGTRCSFLTETGACAIYEIRPIMCRSYGVPLSYTLDDITENRGVCELNFISIDLLTLPPEDFMPVNLSMKHLSALNEQYQVGSSAHRSKLNLKSIMRD
jgi:Fe-S-cluster containining protein